MKAAPRPVDPESPATPAYRCCAAMQPMEIGRVYDDRYGYPDPARAVHCVACGHTQLVDTPPAEALGPMYSTFYPRSAFDPADYHAYVPPRGRIRGWLDGARAVAGLWVRPCSRVLDIGCGYGEMLGYLEGIGCEVEATEIDQNIAELARRRGFKVRIGPFDERNHPQGHFDYVLLNQVIEHFPDPGALLHRIRGVLAPGGTVVITTPNGGGILRRVFGKRWIHWHAPYHVQIFTRRSMLNLARTHGYDVRLLRTLSPSSWLLYQWCHGIGYPEPGHAHPFWSERVPKSLAQRVSYRLIHVATHASRINHLVMRCLDGAGIGDNLLVLLSKP